MKYKVGDKVKYTGDSTDLIKKNQIYTVKKIFESWGETFTRLEEIKESHSYFSDKFELVKPKEFTKSDLKDNHIVVNVNKDKDIWKNVFNHEKYNNNLEHRTNRRFDIIEVWAFDKLVWKREEKPVEILDEAEKKWLKHFIKSTGIKVNSITKYTKLFYNNREYLLIHFKDDDTVFLPYFEKGTMYKGLELNKEYNLKDLGLED